MAASLAIRKRQLEEKLGLWDEEYIKSNFQWEITNITWDILNGRYDIFSHPSLKDEKNEEFVFCILIKDIHASIWAVKDSDLKNVSTLVSRKFVSPCPIEQFLISPSTVRRYHVVFEEQTDRYLVQVDTPYITQAKYDICLYIGTLTISQKALDVIMASIADKTYLLLQSDCLEYCKHFVYLYFELIEEEMDRDQKKLLEKLTVTTSVVSRVGERSSRQHPSSGFSMRSFLTSTFFQVFVGSVLCNSMFLAGWYFFSRT
ncbi:hypothetical protein SNE40_004378 [Patella caerulea]|uniref:Uncharacterized protein n=1 Tax=Patella caerulea TaxID=87958 RepID=A0AAN8K2T4_PATCE